jgi:hypothetical protein
MTYSCREFQGELPTFRLGNLEIEDARRLMPTRFRPISFANKRFIVVHHSATAADTTIEAIHRYHVKMDYGGFGYDLATTYDGRAMLGGNLNTVRAGVAFNNDTCYHVLMIGNFTTAHPPEAQLAITRRVCAELQQAAGWWVPIVPHNVFNRQNQYHSACPGASWPAWWGQLQRRAGE